MVSMNGTLLGYGCRCHSGTRIEAAKSRRQPQKMFVRETLAWPNTNRRRHRLPTFGLPYVCTNPRAAPKAPTQRNGVQSGVRPMACCTLRSRPWGVEHCRRGPDVYVPYVLRASVRWSCSASQVSERRTCLHPRSIPSDSRCPRAIRCPRSAQRPSLMSRHFSSRVSSISCHALKTMVHNQTVALQRHAARRQDFTDVRRQRFWREHD